MNRSRIAWIAWSLALSLFVVGCGDSSEPAGSTAAAPEDVVTIHLTGNDQMQYNKTAFTVPAGATVHLVFEHVGKLAENVMGHDVTILNKGEDVMTFGSELVTNGAGPENDYLPQSMRGRVFVHTEMIGGGETTSIDFTAPAAGEYPYLCTFPGHYAVMNGVMTVK